MTDKTIYIQAKKFHHLYTTKLNILTALSCYTLTGFVEIFEC